MDTDLIHKIEALNAARSPLHALCQRGAVAVPITRPDEFCSSHMVGMRGGPASSPGDWYMDRVRSTECGENDQDGQR